MGHTARRTFLEEHNSRRASLAKGEVKINGEQLQSAANMHFMAYDCDLENKAIELTEACERTPSRIEFNETTINLVGIDSHDKNGGISAGREAVSQWWNQSSQWQNPQKLTMEDKSAIPFFLIAQEEADTVGCSVRSCKKDGVSFYSVACVYGKGVEAGGKLYEQGQTCSCDDGYKCYKSALCKKQ
uniref:SCP extracellular domain containing protein n=1 Tax=Haemonchus contortus TaxID=6289 RepID=U6P2D9_HAECO|nr:SCP extracellular domain containing protein [Haemonchus contortus]CDJ88115.1 SCP extracellular domain containing protein [Haemonchus contortus]